MSHSAEPLPMTARRSGPLSGEAKVPGDKSISHRALILGALSVGETHITGLLEGQDVLDTASAMQAFGAQVERLGEGEWKVNGVGVGGFAEPEGVIDCGNSGTGVRLIMGAMATTPITATFTGDASLSRRPMGRVTDPLELFGCEVTAREGKRLPVTIKGAADPVPVRYKTPVASAQIKSAVLLAGLNAPGETVVIESEPTRDHTERMLAGFGASIRTETTDEGHVITLQGRPELRPQPVAVPRDPSSAAFPVAAALIVPGSEIRVPGVSRNPTRDGLYVTLLEMGADIRFENPREEGGEPVADLVVRHGPLKGVTVPAERAASMIDEFPILSVIACFAEGKTVMQGVHELRVKESDRIDAMAVGLRANGAEVEDTPDTMTVHGKGGLKGSATCATHLDHRIAMSFLVAGLASEQPISVDDGGPIATSFPDFLPLMQRLGARID
ncbi:3-phosphoshikimate 1-carboxyvinyltransferase [Paracoccus sp. P2]|uniref:3-phosphoshikimate 1-carboxyvinyltransferase n=1 Tax=Paracoccus pantotrophus TaxID=82367 RepID=A0A7H9BTD5_PARPN|nr:3-phosphoshikimate 1-carboxyvinyltransferase [Paracoccus pantotrophus]MDF3853374.1 3-phosphoshikimate 1-carboxyvinyltransferase [Paracoccus pantotrophus]QLH14660.1 3-phosphoshikimate 1-carboxyvinyltransferase [Paracoccus pantotrophus]RDD96811.1 3-phosphoshikimate 1-carboxyvinyltransferase [Paracoccus pantotrophus]RNI18956.1 3-phosphoshikimate 1-carboxyvinyltransferase [Paracoccus pantotrophus]WGR64787.1 3-phosphoshikimate 1-carboxyvinyltransferase [Paracoccus pantotrophus]